MVICTMKKPTVRSHYLPRTYLKHFLLNDELVMYKKGEKFFVDPTTTPEQKILIVNGEEGLKNVVLQNHLYDPEVEGTSSDDLEDIFNDYGENIYDDVISRIETLPANSRLPQSIKDDLSFFFATMRVRTPLFKWEVEQMDANFRKHFMARQMRELSPEELVEQYKEIDGKEISLEMATKVRQSFLDKDYELRYPNGFFIKMALMTLEMHADIFHQMTWNIYTSDERYFTTSDNPLVYFVPREHINAYVSAKSLTSPHCEVYFSLTKNLGAHLTWRKDSEMIKTGSRQIVDLFKFNIPRQSLDYLFSPMEMNDLKEYVKQYTPYPFHFS